MIRLLADENVDNRIIKGVQRINPDTEIVRVQDTDLYSKPDPDVLAWAAANGYLVVSHDYRTIPTYAYARIARGEAMTGVLMIPAELPIKEAIDKFNKVVHSFRIILHEFP